MWTREELKNNAKTVLKRGYWVAFAVTLVYGLLIGGPSGVSSGMSNGMNSAMAGTPITRDGYAVLLVMAIILLVLSVIIIIMSIFVSGPMLVGLYRFFLENREHPADFTLLFWGFQGGRYWKNVKVNLWMNVKIFLWSLLLFIPGVVKTYEYCMIPYLLAENPNLPTDRYFELSRKMTDGDKLNIWVLGLSFIGWILLGMLACGLGVLFVEPYIQATYAELYALLRAKIFAQGVSGPEELRGFGPVMGNM